MTNFEFTEAQAEHALQVVLDLMKESRFFLYDHRSSDDSLYHFDPDVFALAIKLNKKIKDVYVRARKHGESMISEAEFNLGVARPDLGNGKSLVQCNRYTGGLDIYSVFPFTEFTQLIPPSFKVLEQELLNQLMGDKTEDDYSPKEMRDLNDCSSKLARIIWDELSSLRKSDPENVRSVVIMKTRFHAVNGDANKDFMLGKVWEIQEFPNALGYLFYKYSMQTQLVDPGYVVFSTSRDAHVNMYYTDEERFTIDFSKKGRYCVKVHFATVL